MKMDHSHIILDALMDGAKAQFRDGSFTMNKKVDFILSLFILLGHEGLNLRGIPYLLQIVEDNKNASDEETEEYNSLVNDVLEYWEKELKRKTHPC